MARIVASPTLLHAIFRAPLNERSNRVTLLLSSARPGPTRGSSCV